MFELRCLTACCGALVLLNGLYLPSHLAFIAINSLTLPSIILLMPAIIGSVSSILLGLRLLQMACSDQKDTANIARSFVKNELPLYLAIKGALLITAVGLNCVINPIFSPSMVLNVGVAITELIMAMTLRKFAQQHLRNAHTHDDQALDDFIQDVRSTTPNFG
jgi:hypothetical protein